MFMKRSNGFTLIELVITVAVLAILTLGVIPLVQVSVKRQKEDQLRATLREMREAIDQFHREAVAGAQMQGNPQPGQQQATQPNQPNQPRSSRPGADRVWIWVVRPVRIESSEAGSRDALSRDPTPLRGCPRVP